MGFRITSWLPKFTAMKNKMLISMTLCRIILLIHSFCFCSFSIQCFVHAYTMNESNNSSNSIFFIWFAPLNAVNTFVLIFFTIIQYSNRQIRWHKAFTHKKSIKYQWIFDRNRNYANINRLHSSSLYYVRFSMTNRICFGPFLVLVCTSFILLNPVALYILRHRPIALLLLPFINC